MKNFVIGVVLTFLFVAGSSWAFDNFHFDSLTFETEVWINNKHVFVKPINANVEFVTAGAFDWVIADKDGNEVKTVRAKNEHAGWTGIDFPSLGLHGDYSIGFRNASSQKQEVKQGDIELR